MTGKWDRNDLGKTALPLGEMEDVSIRPVTDKHTSHWKSDIRLSRLPSYFRLWLLRHFAAIKSRWTRRSKITTRNQYQTVFLIAHHNLPQCPALVRVFSLTLKQAWLDYLGNGAQPSRFTSTQNTWLDHTANDLPAEWTITSWFWQSFAAGVRKETFPKVLAEEMGNTC